MAGSENTVSPHDEIPITPFSFACPTCHAPIDELCVDFKTTRAPTRCPTQATSTLLGGNCWRWGGPNCCPDCEGVLMSVSLDYMGSNESVPGLFCWACKRIVWRKHVPADAIQIKVRRKGDR